MGRGGRSVPGPGDFVFRRVPPRSGSVLPRTARRPGPGSVCGRQWTTSGVTRHRPAKSPARAPASSGLWWVLVPHASPTATSQSPNHPRTLRGPSPSRPGVDRRGARLAQVLGVAQPVLLADELSRGLVVGAYGLHLAAHLGQPVGHATELILRLGRSLLGPGLRL